MAGYLGSRPVVVQVDGYQRTEAESRYVNVSGDDFTGHLDFTDDAKARFGSSDEMHIYTESSGSGYSYIQGDSIVLRKANQSTNYLTAIGGVVSLMHNGTTKLATASGGIDVTGTLTANAGDVKVRSTSGSTLELTNTSTTLGDNAFVGGLAFRNDDTSGSPPHYAGIKARTDGSGGTEMDLEFYANRDKYETDAPHMILRSTGNLGINIADASQKLHVGGNAIITGLTRLGNGTESSPAYQFVDDTNTGMYRSSSDVLGFSTGGANRLTLNSTGAIFAGNVGMGTISPAPDYGSDIALEIKGASSPGLVINDTGQGSKYGIHADSNDLKITYGSGALATFQNDGNVGIGTSAPKRHIHLNGGNETTKIQITNQTTGSGSDGDGFQIGIATDGTANIEQRENADLVFTTNNTERFRIDSAGLISAMSFLFFSYILLT